MTTTSPAYISAKEVSALTGIPYRTTYDMLKSPMCQSAVSRVGRRYLVDRVKLLKLVESGALVDAPKAGRAPKPEAKGSYR